MGGAWGSFALRLGFITDLVIDHLLGSNSSPSKTKIGTAKTPKASASLRRRSRLP
jgi:hypothetical protein